MSLILFILGHVFFYDYLISNIINNLFNLINNYLIFDFFTSGTGRFFKSIISER